ncbi:MAG: GIY-YIG nuclease family protein [Promethearchaeota archaeon]
MTFYVYMIECTDKTGKKTLYTGYTSSLERRLDEHKSGRGARYTRSKTLRLVFFQRFSSRKLAMRRELEIKSMSRAKKLALINDILYNEHLIDY